MLVNSTVRRKYFVLITLVANQELPSFDQFEK